jgi:hypothetical protein
MNEMRIVFDGPPGPEAARFVEVEDADGKSINAGEWRERPDGFWELVIKAHPAEIAEPCMRLIGRILDHCRKDDWLSDVDGCDLQEWGTMCGVFEKVPYDPEKHGTEFKDNWDGEPGDDYYTFTDAARAALGLIE